MSLKLSILGCNSAIPSAERFTTAQVIQTETRNYIIDCGEGIQIRVNDTHIKRGKIHEIFISHLHGDHFFGLPGLLTSFNLSGRTKPITIYGPEGIREFIESLTKIGSFFLNYDLIIIPTQTRELEKIHEDNEVEVYSFPLKHRIPTTGFLFREKQREPNIIPEKIGEFELTIDEIKLLKEGHDVTRENGKKLHHIDFTIQKHEPKTYAFCSDTIYDPELVKYIEGVDLLYHEATYLEALKNKAHDRMHATAKEAATIAKMANVKKLLLGHFSSRYKDTSKFMEEAATIFPETEIAYDGMEIEV